MEKKNFREYTDEEFREAFIATMNLKSKWLEEFRQREKELGFA